MEMRMVQRALLSVHNKTGVVDFARFLSGRGVELISSGGTYRVLKEARVPVIEVSDVTHFPEILDGRVKTLHPHIHAGLLAVRGNPEHQQTLARLGIGPIDLVACNLYPFEATVARSSSSEEEIIENIDVGGPTMIRAAAKNYRDVAIATNPEQYESIQEELQANSGALGLATRRRLATEAFARTAAYDQAISQYFQAGNTPEPFPEHLDLHFDRRAILRYGENPHQQAALYMQRDQSSGSLATAELLHGKELSFNNILDLESAWRLVREFQEPAAVVIKHNNPCGTATGPTPEDAFRKAYQGDPVSAYGGVLGFNRPLDEATALQITEPNRFIECIVAPEVDPAAYQLLTTRPSWKKSVRLLRVHASGQTNAVGSLDYRRIDGGILVQMPDALAEDDSKWKVVTLRVPSAAEMADLRFAWLVCKHVKSNAIVFATQRMVVGVGAGQMSRVDSVHLAARKAGTRSHGAVMASDAFFPFRDNIDEAAKAGITAVIQPGGSIRDQESIQACDEHNMSMVLTGIRHFRH